MKGEGNPSQEVSYLAGRSFDLQQSPGLISSDQVTEMVLTRKIQESLPLSWRFQPAIGPRIVPIDINVRMDSCHQVAPNCSQDQKGLVPGASCQPAPQAHLNHFITLAIMVPTIFRTDVFGPHLLHYGCWGGESYCLFLLHKLPIMFCNLFFVPT